MNDYSGSDPSTRTTDPWNQVLGNSKVVGDVVVHRLAQAREQGGGMDMMDVRDELFRLSNEMRGRWTGASSA